MYGLVSLSVSVLVLAYSLYLAVNLDQFPVTTTVKKAAIVSCSLENNPCGTTVLPKFEEVSPLIIGERTVL